MKRAVVLLSLVLGVSGCATTTQQMLPTDGFASEPIISPRTKSQDILAALPGPKEKITLSVYEFNDQTGQNKSGDIAEYSRAVTQGGLAILKKALLDAGDKKWFRVLERGGLNDLLQERKIIRSTREEFLGPDGKPLSDLGPLLYSGVLLEGGIIAYESNIMTGGAGARYLGIGGSSEYRRDIVTVALRAVSVVNGEVLLAVNTSKTIYSTSVQGDFFKFVSFDKLLEAEGGVTYNEPPQFAVRQAIEMAVYSLIMEGYEDGLWQFSDSVAGQKAYREYVARRGQAETPTKAVAAVAGENKPKAPAQVSEDKPNKAAASTPTAAKTSKDEENSSKKTALAAREPERQEGSHAGQPVPTGWYTQVAAVKTNDPSVTQIIGELKRTGLPVIVERATIESVPYNRVLVGPFADASMAAKAKSKVLENWNGTVFPFVKHYE